MDGNNRWSKKNNISKFEAYKSGSENLIKLSKFVFNNYDIKYISAFALSSNNLRRSSKVINILKKVFIYFLDKIKNQELSNFEIKIIGDLSFLDKIILEKTNNFLKKQKKSKKKLILFINYSGKTDIENAHKKLLQNKNNPMKLSDFLTTSDIPDPDVLFRTGGFQRLSNFMLYEISFTELFFTKKLWPEINNGDLKKVIEKYHTIERKFGF